MNYALLSTVAADRLTQGDNQRMEEVGAKGVRLGKKTPLLTWYVHEVHGHMYLRTSYNIRYNI